MTNETETAVEETTAAPAKKVSKKVVKKVATKKVATKTAAPSKKATKAPKAAKPAKEAESGVERANDLPWCEKKLNLFKALKALKATSALNAAVGSVIVEKAAGTLSPRDVRHYSYHARAANLIEICDVESGRGYGFYLTATGAAVDLVKIGKELAKAVAE